MNRSHPRFSAKVHLANVLGAFTVALGDELRDALRREAGGGVGVGRACPAAVLALDTWSGESVEFLAGVGGLTHSGAVRLMDRLVANGLAVRQAGRDRRTVALRLTARGRAVARHAREARAEVLLKLVDAMTATEQQVVGRALDRLLRQGPRTRTQARHACRLCDHSVCRGDDCPVGCSVRAS